MIPVCTRAQVRELDRRAIEDLGLPGVALMELASRALASLVMERFASAAQQGVLVLCGGGNNGGDGYGAARFLYARGVPVTLCSLASRSGGDAGIMRAVAERLGIPEVSLDELLEGAGSHGVYIDAIFGTGLSRPIRGEPARAIRFLNAQTAPVVAADLPSGLDADTGVAHGELVRADASLSFGAAKPGLFAGEGLSAVGELHVDTLGLDALRHAPRLGGMPEVSDLQGLWPKRSKNDHKSRSGHVGIVAGSTAMAGAAVLCCRGALAAGAGLVTLFAPAGALPRLAQLPPEVMVQVCGPGDVCAPPAPADHGRVHGWVLGPGLGGGHALPGPLAAWVSNLWKSDARPVLSDADALVHTTGPSGGRVRVLTPHAGEAGRLLGLSAAEVERDRVSAALALAETGHTALLKGPYTLIAESGCPVHVNGTGSAALATGGSGDVLAGVIGALLVRGLSGHTAATLGAWVHGRAGERLTARREAGWTASDIAAEVPLAIQDLVGP